MVCAKAFAPGNISALFKPVYGNTPELTHSLGLGLTIREGVTASVQESLEASLRFNGNPIEISSVRKVVSRLSSQQNLSIELNAALPLSSGFGLSGASALAVALATNQLLNLGMTRQELALVAHAAEVECLTGLGDICGQFHGGCLVKLTPGNPLSATRVDLDRTTIFYKCYGPLATDRVLSDPSLRNAIDRAADEALLTLTKGVDFGGLTLARCLQISYAFSQASGLLRLTQVGHVIRDIIQAGGNASMIMLGNSVFSDTEFEGSLPTEVIVKAAAVIE